MIVPSMLTVQLEITGQFVNANQDTREIPMVPFAPKVRKNNFDLNFFLQGYFFSSTVPVKVAECITDKDCPSRQSCLQEKCKDPCQEISPCAPNSKCTVHNSLPLRTMSCTCLPGFTGRGDERCEIISKFTIPGMLSSKFEMSFSFFICSCTY